MVEPVSGGSAGPEVAAKGRRFAAGVIDLIIIPIILGVVVGLFLLAVPDWIRSVVLVLVNIGWLIFRDYVYSPGRAMVGTKLISLTSDKVSLAQAFIRNILLLIPFVLVVGYLIEIIALLAKGERIADGWAKTRVVQV
ncbi:MAG: RDD family protein [Candidatus Omnitrophica bacterium]|nr:RDD family protein [Candidatus Omnitrophota bacterium]MDD5672357.1 RDD family protein [Candidatus Omnitrophota bacterium]